MGFDTCVEKSDFILKALKRLLLNVARERTHDLQYRLAFRMRYPDNTAARSLALRADFIRLQKFVTRRLNKWRHDQWSATHESLDPEDQSLWRMTEKGDEGSYL